MHLWYWGMLGAVGVALFWLFVLEVALAVPRQWWAFNSANITGSYWLGLPVEEYVLLVFMALGVVQLFRVVELKTPGIIDRQKMYWRLGWVGMGALMILGLNITLNRAQVWHQERFLFELATTVVVLLVLMRLRSFVGRRAYWRWFVVAAVAFVGFDALLNAVGSIDYHPQHNSGLFLVWVSLDDSLYALGGFFVASVVMFASLRYLVTKSWTASADR